MKRRSVFLLFILVIFFAGFSAAEDPRLEASLEAGRVTSGNPLYLYITFYGAQDVDRPEVPPVSGLQMSYRGPTTKMSVINGKVSRSITHTFLILPLKEGEYMVGPFFVDHDGKVFRSDAVRLVVTASPSSPAGPPATPPALSSGAEPDASGAYESENIFLIMEIDKRTMYLNEIVPVNIKLYVRESGLRDIEYPFYQHEGVSTTEFVEPERTREFYKGGQYDVLVFRQNIIGIQEGDFVIGPAKLNCKLMVRETTARRRSSIFGRSVFDDDFFNNMFDYRVVPIELNSGSVPITVLPFPKEERPADFEGAVGSFSLNVDINPKTVNVGDPIVVRMSVRGNGDLGTVSVPKIITGEKFKTYEPHSTTKDNTKIYEQILIPKSADVKQTPEVRFSYFNPIEERYKTEVKGPFPIEVTEKAGEASTVQIVSMPGVEETFYPQEELGQDLIFIKEDLGKAKRKGQYLRNSPVFWAGQFAPFVLVSVYYVRRRKEERIRTDKRYARFLKAPHRARKELARAKAHLSKNEMIPFYDAVFRALQDYLGGKFNIPKGNVTVPGLVERLSSAECDSAILEELKDILAKCEMARYASTVAGKESAESMLENVKKIIDHIEKLKV